MALELIGLFVFILIAFSASVLFAYILQGDRSLGVIDWVLFEFRNLSRKE